MQPHSHVRHPRRWSAWPDCSGRCALVAALGALGALFLCIGISGLTGPPHAAPRVSAEGANKAIRVNSSFTFADLDGDRQPDLATADIEHADSHLTRYLIRLRLQAGGSGASQAIGVTGSFGLPQISALDVNGDDAPDLVVTAAGQPRPIAVLLNDGRGRFSVANPSDFSPVVSGARSQWRPASNQFDDNAVLVSPRAPQTNAASSRQRVAPKPLSTALAAVNRGYAPSALRLVPLGRAPPRTS